MTARLYLRIDVLIQAIPNLNLHVMLFVFYPLQWAKHFQIQSTLITRRRHLHQRVALGEMEYR